MSPYPPPPGALRGACSAPGAVLAGHPARTAAEMENLPPASLPARVDLEAAPPDVKRYHRLKLAARFCSRGVQLASLATLALLAGPWIGHRLRPALGDD